MRVLCRIGVLALLILTGSTFGLSLPYVPRPPGYSVEPGDFVFVMLSTECVNEPAEIVVTPPVLEALRAQYARIEKMIEAAYDGDPPTPFPYPATCEGARARQSGLSRIRQ